MATRSPSVRMRRLGAQLRRLREERGLDLDEAADFLKISGSALSRMENAQVMTRRHEVEYILMKYGVEDEQLCASLLGLAAAGRSRDWIQRRKGPSPGEGAGEFVRLEQDSSTIREYHPVAIPGLLQTPEYARAVMESPPTGQTPDLAARVDLRMARKEVLTRPAPAIFIAVIGEAALRQNIGGAQVLQGQLSYLHSVSEQPNIRLQVLPFSAAGNPGHDGGFILLDVAVGGFTVVFLDGLRRAFFLEEDEDVDAYRTVFQALCDTALPVAESREIIQRFMREARGTPG
ncbi:helix-turn-helix domain-containing protein [Actinomadura viridis]|uniref:helix-turn-helix domain-containing protein n=1 Tax=Actinomadura viridis TaxID=58110 RepID=UPI0036BA6BC8